MPMPNQTIVDESFVRESSQTIRQNLNELNSIIHAYLALLKAVMSRMIKEGETAEALGAFIEYAEKLQDQLVQIGEIVALVLCSYLEEIDSADSYLF